MSEPVSDHDRSDLPTSAPVSFPPASAPRWMRIARGLGVVLACAAVVIAAFVLITAMDHAGRTVQHDVRTVVGRALERIGDRMATAHCGPLPGW